jgi:type II secretory pathway pseudopilin PulG
LSSFLTVLISVVGVLGGALVYAWQKVLDRREDQRNELKDAYINYLISVERISLGNNDGWEARREHRLHKQLVDILAPNTIRLAVMNYESAWLDWQLTCTQPEDLQGDKELFDKVTKIGSDLVNSVRADLQEQSSVKSHIKELIPFWGAK